MGRRVRVVSSIGGAMSVRFHVPEVIRRYSGGVADVVVDGATVRAAVESLLVQHPELRLRMLDPAGRLYPYFVVLRNDRELARATALDESLDDGDVVELVGAAEGG